MPTRRSRSARRGTALRATSIPPLSICFTGHVSSDSREIAIERGGVNDVAALRELWLELHHHHAQVAPQSGEFVDDESSWRVRSWCYREWLADPGSFLLLARAQGRVVGYALVRVMEAGPELTDSWRVPEVIAEIETMLVSAPFRGAGLGTRLLDEIDAELERQGITEVIVGLMPGNDGAQRLYECRGYRRRWLVLARGEWS
jgi:ribosomal protein S18 acetylase RimI-like enzyme